MGFAQRSICENGIARTAALAECHLRSIAYRALQGNREMTTRNDPQNREEAIEYVANMAFDQLMVAADGLAEWLRAAGEEISVEEARGLLMEKIAEKNEALKPTGPVIS
jgi:hypothetical protein